MNGVEREISIAEFRRALKQLPEDDPYNDPRKWYLTQKEHWLGWLGRHHGPWAYGHQTGVKRDAKFAYNHIVEPKMLLYLVYAIPKYPFHPETHARAAQIAGSSFV